jgi:hypothetical protein
MPYKDAEYYHHTQRPKEYFLKKTFKTYTVKEVLHSELYRGKKFNKPGILAVVGVLKDEFITRGPKRGPLGGRIRKVQKFLVPKDLYPRINGKIHIEEKGIYYFYWDKKLTLSQIKKLNGGKPLYLSPHPASIMDPRDPKKVLADSYIASDWLHKVKGEEVRRLSSYVILVRPTRLLSATWE